MKFFTPFRTSVLALLLLGLNIFVGIQVFTPEPGVLEVSFLDVGQGDSIFIQTPSGIQMLIDGGKDRSVLRELPKVMSPLDRSIDVVVATHPDADHIGGLSDVLERYHVQQIITSGREGDSGVYEALEDARMREPGAMQIIARQGMRLHLGDGVYADIYHPEANVAKLRETNDASIIMRLVYGDTEFMLTGDAPAWVEERIVAAHGDALKSDVLKAGHHGSKTSTSAVFLDAVDPSVVVVSAGKGNSYGHPHAEVVERSTDSGAAVLGTMDEGSITFVSDGKTVTRK